MKNISTLLGILSLVLIGVLFYLHFNHGDAAKPGKLVGSPSEKTERSISIAYFEMDSVENNLEYVKDAMEKFKAKEQQMNTQLNTMKNSYQKRISEWNQKGANMSQAESENAQKEYNQMNENYLSQKQKLEMELQDLQFKMAQEMNKTIEDFLKQYNKDKGYSYIMTSQPGLIYYKDTVYNITNDLIAGLNQEYKSKKK